MERESWSTHLRIHRRINPGHQQRHRHAHQAQQSNSPPDQTRPTVASFSSMKSDVERVTVEGCQRPEVSVGVKGESGEEEEGEMRFDLSAGEEKEKKGSQRSKGT